MVCGYERFTLSGGHLPRRAAEATAKPCTLGAVRCLILGGMMTGL